MRFDFGKQQVIETRKIDLYTEYPFDSAIKKMSVVYRNAAENVNETYTIGAPEVVIPCLSLSQGEAQNIQETADRMAGEGLRVLCIAYKNTTIDQEDQISPRSAAE